MKKYILLFLAFVFYNSIVYSQKNIKLKKVLELKMTSLRGANAASVAWHPTQKKYYAAIAGNVEHQMLVYDALGKRLSDTSLTAMFDVRGFWYNANTKTLQANGYNDFGWTTYLLNAKGIPTDIKPIFENLMNQPDAQSVGTYNYKNNKLYFFNSAGNIDQYNVSSGLLDTSINLHLSFTSQKEMDDSFEVDNSANYERYNYTSVVYTGIKNSEIGLLNHTENQIELYDIKTGFVTQKLLLPINAPISIALNFSYANGIYWLFDKVTRIWIGYK